MTRLLKQLLVTTVLVGASDAASAETLTVYWNAGHAFPGYEEAIKRFEEANPGWTVQWERFQWPDLRTKLVADFAAGSPPDLVAEPGGWVQEFAQQGMLRPLNDFIERDGARMGYPDDWQDVAVGRNMLDDQYFGVQLHLTCATLVYNEDMLKEAGFDKPPTTWEEFREVALATAKNGRFGFAPNAVATYHWPWIWQNGGGYYDPATNKVTFDSPESAEAVQFLADLIHKDRAAPVPVAGADYEGPQKLFTAGRAAMIFTGPWDATPINTGNPNLNWSIAPSLTRATQATQAGGVSLMIPKASDAPEMAWELLKELVALETEVTVSKAHGMTMPRKSWAADAQVQADPIVGRFSECLPYARDHTAELRLTGKSARVEELFQAAMEDILYNNRPAQEVLSEYAAQANQVLAGQ